MFVGFILSVICYIIVVEIANVSNNTEKEKK